MIWAQQDQRANFKYKCKYDKRWTNDLRCVKDATWEEVLDGKEEK